MVENTTRFEWPEDLEPWDEDATRRVDSLPEIVNWEIWSEQPPKVPLAAIIIHARGTSAKSNAIDPPTLEIPMILIEEVELDARTPADWERVSVEMDAADSIDNLLQSVDNMIEGDDETQVLKVPLTDLLARNTRPVSPQPQPYKAGPWLPL